MMPGILNKRKRTSTVLSDSDEQSEVSNGSSGGKRARHARDASGSPASTNDNGETGTYNQDAHQPGSLVRVKLTNFVTYTAAEFKLGPSLNMIIGPNGTGKSTLVCAICLGLSWSPIHLGRAKEIGEFVKHGQSEAQIEIELAASAGHRSNPVIRRVIKKEGNKSAFFIDNRAVTQKEVTALARSFSIQIDNLCQFLPQDRVSEFAKLDPVALLKETQRAAAPEHMVQWHDELKELRRDEKKVQSEQQNEGAHLKGLQDKQNATRADVVRWNERQALVSKSQLLEKSRPIIVAKIRMKEIKEKKASMRAKQRELLQYEAEVEPAQRAQREMEAYRDQVEPIAKSRKIRLENGKSAVNTFSSKIDSQQQTMIGIANEIDGEKKADRDRKLDRKRIESEIVRLQRAIDDKPVELDAAAHETQQSDIRSKRSNLSSRKNDAKGTINSIRPDVMNMQEKLRKNVAERQTLDTQLGQRDKALSRLSPHTSEAWTWLEKNKASLGLREDVHAPPLISCSVSDPHLAKIVETQIRGHSILAAITCTNPHDSKIVQDKLVGRKDAGGLGLHSVTIRTSPKPLNWYKPPVTDSELRALGFDSWIIDYIQGPDPVLAMLCDSAQIHRAAHASKPLTDQQFEAMQKSGISRGVSGNEAFAISTRAEYNASSTRFNKVNEARHFTDQPVDADEKNRLDQAISELEQNIANCKVLHNEAAAEIKAIEAEEAQVEKQKAMIQKEQDDKRKAVAQWESLPRRIAAKNDELKNINSLSADTHHRIRLTQRKYEAASLQLANFTVHYSKTVIQLRALHESYVEAEIRLIEAASEVEGHMSDNQHIDQVLQEMRAQLNILTTDFNTSRAKLKQETAKANAIIGLLSPEENDAIQEYTEYTIDELSNEISAIDTRLSMMAEGNPNAIKAYEKREQDIKTAQEKLENRAYDLEATRAKITEIREQWEPELDKLVSKISDGFSHNFDMIGCAGQVGVYKDEDFEKWSIQIQVRFRENESLQVLTAQRQSGGERAVSTIFYLMALQDLARSPFRVVDEINQGMDPRNERMVHERMVDIACRERTSQYFLITPKLLNDLKFHPKMMVHCIASGEHMPDQDTKLDFQELAKIALLVRKPQAVRAST